MATTDARSSPSLPARARRPSTWLVAMPAAELEAWVGAQQELAPKIAATCA